MAGWDIGGTELGRRYVTMTPWLLLYASDDGDGGAESVLSLTVSSSGRLLSVGHSLGQERDGILTGCTGSHELTELTGSRIGRKPFFRLAYAGLILQFLWTFAILALRDVGSIY